MKLKEGNIIEYPNGNLKFIIIDINEDKNWCKVKCIGENNREWEEEWNDLNNVYNAIENGEYLLNNPCEPYETITMPYYPLYDTVQDYCFFDEPKGYGSYKNSGKPRKNAKKRK